MRKGVKRASEKALLGLMTFVAANLVVSVGFAAQWRVTPKLSAAATYSDNVDIDDQGQNTSDVVLVTSPGVTISGTGNRLRLNLDYSGSYYVFVDSGREQYRNNLSGLISLDAIENFLTIDARASISTPFINQRGARSFSGANFSANRRERQTYSISPKFQRRLSSFATATLQYTFRHTNIQNPVAGNPFGVDVPRNEDHDTTFSLRSGPDFNRLSWRASGNYERTQRGGGRRTTERRDGKLNLEYRVTRWLGVLADGGWQKIEDATLTREVDGVTWAGGVRLNPSRRTDVSIRYGKQDGRQQWNFNGNYRLKRIRFGASYSERITTSQRIVSDAVDTFSVDDDGNFVDSFGNPLEADQGAFGQIDEAFVVKRFQFDISYNHRRTNARIRSFIEERNIESLATMEQEAGVSLTLGRTLSQRSNISGTMIFRHIDFQTGASRVDKTYGARVAYSYRISERVSGSVNYSYSRRSSNENQFGLSENTVTVQVRATF